MLFLHPQQVAYLPLHVVTEEKVRTLRKDGETREFSGGSPSHGSKGFGDIKNKFTTGAHEVYERFENGNFWR